MWLQHSNMIDADWQNFLLHAEATQAGYISDNINNAIKKLYKSLT